MYDQLTKYIHAHATETLQNITHLHCCESAMCKNHNHYTVQQQNCNLTWSISICNAMPHKEENDKTFLAVLQ